MSKLIDLTGKKFGRLAVVGRAPNNKKSTMWLCKCDCGNEVVVNGSSLKRKLTKSCGCWNKELLISNCFKHGKTNTRLYNIWAGIKVRCYNTQSQAYELYGGRGIIMWDEWKNDYLSFEKWAMDNGYSDKLSIDRIDVNGNYEPSNCRWADRVIQQNNTTRNNFITYEGKTHTTAEWARILGINYHTLQTRLHRNGWSVEKSFTESIKI